jgi:hypothetical protein
MLKFLCSEECGTVYKIDHSDVKKNQMPLTERGVCNTRSRESVQHVLFLCGRDLEHYATANTVRITAAQIAACTGSAVEVVLGVQPLRRRCASRVWNHLETPRLFRSRNCWPRNKEPSNRRCFTSHRAVNLCNELLLPRTILRKPGLGFTAKKSQFLRGKCFPRHHEDR